MKAEFYKVRGTEMEEMIKRGNINEISSMISQRNKRLQKHLKTSSSTSLSAIWNLQATNRTALISFKDNSKC